MTAMRNGLPGLIPRLGLAPSPLTLTTGATRRVVSRNRAIFIAAGSERACEAGEIQGLTVTCYMILRRTISFLGQGGPRSSQVRD